MAAEDKWQQPRKEEEMKGYYFIVKGDNSVIPECQGRIVEVTGNTIIVDILDDDGGVQETRIEQLRVPLHHPNPDVIMWGRQLHDWRLYSSLEAWQAALAQNKARLRQQERKKQERLNWWRQLVGLAPKREIA